MALPAIDISINAMMHMQWRLYAVWRGIYQKSIQIWNAGMLKKWIATKLPS